MSAHRSSLYFSLGAVISLCGCPGTEPATFTLNVTPEAVEDTIPGQTCVLLVTIDEYDPTAFAEPVTITATAEGATAIVENGTVLAGEIAEVEVSMLSPASELAGANGWTGSALIRGERSSVIRQIEVPITLTSDEDDTLGPAAAEMRDLFIPWLTEHRPALGIDETTAWAGTIVKPHWLVVSHYLYFSDEWEMHVSWHVMIPPYDWARIELRRRFEEMLPSLAFEVPSISASEPLVVSEIDPEGILWR